MILEDFALLASDTARTKAYIQEMIREEKVPKMCVVYSGDIKKMQEDAKRYTVNKECNDYFDVNMPVLLSLDHAGIPYRIVKDRDINSDAMREVLGDIEPAYLIYSGYGGAILRKPLFGLGKKFVHVHAGILPQYRGSTTAYYSFLMERKFGATAIFLSEGIDEGEIIVQETFGLPKKGTDMDYIYEPYIRSKVLIKAVNLYLENNNVLTGRKQDEEAAKTYFIIHPVLKHLALMGMDKSV